MKRTILILLILVNILFSSQVKEEYLSNIEKYKDLEFNREDVGYAEKYKDNAIKQLGSKYNYLKDKKYNNPNEIEKVKKVFKEKYNLKEPSLKEREEFREKYSDLEKIKRIKKDSKNEVIKEVEYLEEGEVIEIIVEDEETLKDIEDIEKKKKEKNENKKNMFENIKYQNNLLDNKKYFTNKIDSLKVKFDKYNKSNMTIMFFVSSDIRTESIKGFVEHINKLRRKGYNAVGRVIFRGWINDKIDGIPNWLKEKQEDGLKDSSFVKYQFHPWAFKHFGLQRVPAYALSSCYENFRFRDCENKYLIKGDISLIEFFNILKEHHKEYKDIYVDLIEVG